MSENVTTTQVIKKYGRPLQKVTMQLDSDQRAVEVYSHDEYGLALDPVFWCDSGCNHCFGKGRIWKVDMQTSLVEGERKREMHPCPCSLRGYTKVRKEVETRIHAAQHRGGDEEACRELERIHAENGHGIKLTKQPERA